MSAASYTVCAAGPPACDFAKVQDAIDTAVFGDKILLQAGETFDGFKLRYKPGPDGDPIVITTSAEAYLPAAGTRITPAYAAGTSPITARILGHGTDATITTENGWQACPGDSVACPAHDYALVGLEIVPGDGAYDHVQIGPITASDGVTTAEGFPYNITLDRTYIHQDPLKQVRRCVTPHGRNIAIENSWIAGCKMRGVDSQAIESWSGPGPLKIVNNYLEASTEIVAFGGAMPVLPGVLAQQVEVAFNHFYRPDFYVTTTWTASTWYGQGQFLVVGNGFQYLAQNGGTSGASAPLWPQTPGATASDGEIVWKAEPDDNTTRWLVKNLLESKSSDGLLIHDNVLERNPAAAQNGTAILLTVRSGQSGPLARVWNTTLRNNVVRDANGALSALGRDDADPNLREAWSPSAQVSRGDLRLPRVPNGFQYRAQTPGKTAAQEPAWPLTAGARVADQNVIWAAEPLPAAAWVWRPDGPAGTTHGITVRNNLFAHMGPGYGWGSSGDTTPVFGIYQGITGLLLDHNTIDSQSAETLQWSGYPGFGGSITNNLMSGSRYGMGGWNFAGDTFESGCQALNYFLCNDPAAATYPNNLAQCPAGAFTNNVISGYSIAGQNPCHSPDQIPAGNWGTAWNQIGFASAAQQELGLTTASPFQSSATDGTPLGANPAQLPLIQNLGIAATDTSATFTYRAPNATACTLQVSADREFHTVVADVDPTRFAQADSDALRGPAGLDRSFTVGQNVLATGIDGQNYDRSLLPGTVYWYWLACGGDGRTGSFTTTRTASAAVALPRGGAWASVPRR